MRLLHRWLLVGLVATILLSNALWLHLDQRPTDMDQGRYMLMVHGFADGWQQPDGELATAIWRGNHPTHPHLVPLLASLLFSLAGRSVDAAYFVNTLFHVGLVLLAFLFVRDRRDAASGLLAATLVAAMPLLSRFSRFFLLEEAAAFFVVASLYCALRTRHLTHLGWSLATGVAVGLGMLTKWTTLLFVAPPLAWLVVAAVIRERSATPVWKLAAAAGCTLLVAAPWYVAHGPQLVNFYVYAEEGGLFVGDGPGWSQLGFYLRSFWDGSGWPFTLLAVLGLAHLASRRDDVDRGLLLAVLVPLATFSFLISTRDLRHLLPSFPILLIAAAVAICSLPLSRLARRGVTASVVALALVSFVHSAWGLADGKEPIDLGPRWTLLLPESRPPDRRDFRFDDLLARVEADAGAGDAPIRVVVVPGNLPFRANGFAFAAAERHARTRIRHVPFYIPADKPRHLHLGADWLLDGGYLLVRSGDVNGNRTGIFHFAKAVHRYLERAAGADDLFAPLYTTELPSGHVARVLRIERPRCDEALLEYLDWAHRTDPDDPGIGRLVTRCAGQPGELRSLWRNLAALLAADGEVGSERAFLDEALAVEPQVRWLLRWRADTLRAAGELEAAAEAYAALGPDAPYLCSPFLDAGRCRIAAGDPAAAKVALERATEDTPDCAAAHHELAALYAEAGDENGARRERRKAELLDNQDAHGPRDTARFRILLGDLAHREGEMAEARHHYAAAVRNEPDDPELRRHLDELAGVSAEPEGDDDR